VDGKRWQELASLLESRGDAEVYRVEIDDRDDATVVFGDDRFGRRPDETAEITATYRVGGGAVGNVGAGTLVRLPRDPADPAPEWFISVTNPLAAVGGRDPESRDHARRYAPETFRKPLVAVTAEDYGAAAEALTLPDGRIPVQRASAGFRWTGSWLTAMLAVDPRESETLDEELRRALLRHLDERRLAGYDLEIRRALYVPIELEIAICVADGFRGEEVKRELYAALGAGVLPDGRRGLFQPDNFSFGDRLHVSRVFAAVMAVPGVESAEITLLARLHSPRPEAETALNLRRGAMEVGVDRIVRLANDRNAPENGTLRIRVKGEER
jgi:predicted phage baseplate assembly protein